MAAPVEIVENDEDVKLIKASSALFDDLQASLPKLLWKPSKIGASCGSVHTSVWRKDLDYILKLIEPFQGEPQLLDARLKTLLPPIVAAFLDSLRVGQTEQPKAGALSSLEAFSTILYTFCKVRGPKIIVGFFNNEPRYLDLVLGTLERTTYEAGDDAQVQWQVLYILLLWLSHLLLAPFDLASISSAKHNDSDSTGINLPQSAPHIVHHVVGVGVKYLSASTKAQEAGASMLVRVCIRPDMQALDLPQRLVSWAITQLQHSNTTCAVASQNLLGPLRFLAGMAASADSPKILDLMPDIYRACQSLVDSENATARGFSAVAKKLTIKTLRSIALCSLRPASGRMLNFLDTTAVLEEAIDFILQSLADQDTPVRYAAAKSISVIVLQLEDTLGYEIIQAVLDTFKEDIPKGTAAFDPRTTNPLKWHGFTLALAHVVFKRSAAPAQLAEIIEALLLALNFEQRTATGSVIGTNVRDAACFGIWSLSRRYTTTELLSVSTASSRTAKSSVIQHLAINLILSATLDPAGNMRRGSSAGLQELVGRHPDNVHGGISLVQTVEYQAVGLRRRAMVDVACVAAGLHKMYWEALVNGLMGWRGLGSGDVLSREAAATALGKLSVFDTGQRASEVVEKVRLETTGQQNINAEKMHGLLLALSAIVEESLALEATHFSNNTLQSLWSILNPNYKVLQDFSPRALRAELPSALARLMGSLATATIIPSAVPRNAEICPDFAVIDTFLDRLLARQEEPILSVLSQLVRPLLALKRRRKSPLGALGSQAMMKKVESDSSKISLSGVGRAIALGALYQTFTEGDEDGKNSTAIVNTLGSIVTAMNVDWRIIGMRALQLVIESIQRADVAASPPLMADIIAEAVHRGLNDYTIDERGDVGSLVRLQALECIATLRSGSNFHPGPAAMQALDSDVLRLSLEKLDRVRLRAAQCLPRSSDVKAPVSIADVSSYDFFSSTFSPLHLHSTSPWQRMALLQGAVSCCGISAEPLLQASRSALGAVLGSLNPDVLCPIMTDNAAILKSQLSSDSNTHPSLELLAYLLDARILHLLDDYPNFKWLNLLSVVQKSHHKSNDIPKILAAVHVYRGLYEVQSIEHEVMKKLISMLKTNPYPRIRYAVAETLLVLTGDEALKPSDWSKPMKQHAGVVEELQSRYIGGL